MTEPGKKAHERMVEHLRAQTRAHARLMEKAQAAAQAHLDSQPVHVAPTTESEAVSVDTTDQQQQPAT
jgi:hypothetical protein